jgi:hypothetical protein
MWAKRWQVAMNEAYVCEMQRDWAGTEAAYRSAISLSKNCPLEQWRTYNRIHLLYVLLDRDEAALTAVQSASACARRHPIPAILSMALLDEAKFLLDKNQTEQAWSLIAESLQIVQKEPVNNLERAYALVLRARCFLRSSDYSQAESDLDTAWNELEAEVESSDFPGVQGVLATWWTTKAHLGSMQNDLFCAVAALREAVARRRLVARTPQLRGPYKWNWLAMALCDLSVLLERAGDESGSAEALAESTLIRESIGLRALM